jgi:transcriptional regulator with XRE-family HTH domain
MRLPPDQCERIFAGEPPLKVWREFRDLAVTDVRRDTKISVERLEKLERGLVKPTRAEILKLARALDIAAHNLDPHHAAYRTCGALDLDEDAILAAADEPDSAS